MNTNHSATAGYMNLFRIYPGVSRSTRELLSVWIFDASLIQYDQLEYLDPLVKANAIAAAASIAEAAEAKAEKDSENSNNGQEGEQDSEDFEVDPNAQALITSIEEEVITLMHRDFQVIMDCKLCPHVVTCKEVIILIKLRSNMLATTWVVFSPHPPLHLAHFSSLGLARTLHF